MSDEAIEYWQSELEKIETELAKEREKCKAYEEALKFYQVRSYIPIREICMAYVDSKSTYDVIEQYTSKAREVLAKYGDKE